MSSLMLRGRVGRVGLALSLLAAFEFDRAALAEPARVVSLRAAGQCPSASQVREELVKIRPGIATDATAIGATIEVADDGPRYRVRINGAETTYPDAGRHCDLRAHAVAYFFDAADKTRERAAFAALLRINPSLAEEEPQSESAKILRLEQSGKKQRLVGTALLASGGLMLVTAAILLLVSQSPPAPPSGYNCRADGDSGNQPSCISLAAEQGAGYALLFAGSGLAAAGIPTLLSGVHRQNQAKERRLHLSFSASPQAVGFKLSTDF
jgi:hypothetical protein